MDAITSLQGSATTLGSVKKTGLILASDNAIALDTVASKLIGYNPDKLPQNYVIRKRKIKGCNLDDIEILGEDINSVKITDFKKPSTILHFLTKSFFFTFEPKIRPKLNKDKCTMCGLCAKSCPVDSIKLDDHPKFNYSLCIRCYCCSEVCQNQAIEIEVPLLWRIVS
jgi:ferredoxin